MTAFTDELARLQAADAIRPYPGDGRYLVTRDGRVSNIARNAWLKPCRLKRGQYLGVCLWRGSRGRTIPVHKLVAETFLGPPPSPAHEVAHGDGNRRNNAASNLSWKTRLENEADKLAHGTSRRRSIGRPRVLDLGKATAIRQRARAGATHTSLAKEYRVSITHIGNIVAGKRWIHV